jgi:predicted RNase H-like HicB family nuclease
MSALLAPAVPALTCGVITPWREPGDFLFMPRSFNVVIERDEDGFYIASVPELHGCHTQAQYLDILMERIREAIELCLDVQSPADA